MPSFEMNHGEGGFGASKNVLSNETILLSQLIQLLDKRPEQMLLLSDLGALVPTHLRATVKEMGGVRNCLQKFPGLFEICGSPGKESVTLILKGKPKGSPGQAVPAPNPQQSTINPSAIVPPFPSINVAGDCQVDSQQDQLQQNMALYESKKGSADQIPKDTVEENRDNSTALQLRGLPYQASVNDIKAFLGRHVSELKEETGSQAIQLVVDHDGRPSGFARVEFKSLEAAERCKEEIHLKSMENRYIECFMYNNELNKRTIAEESAEVERQRPAKFFLDVSHVTREQVRQEVEDYIKLAGRNRLLLSMLGVALSREARTFLKKIDQGLKACLVQYPHLFQVEGTKGCETVIYLPGIEAEAEARRKIAGDNKPSSPKLGAVDRSSLPLGFGERTPIRGPLAFPAKLEAELAAAGSPVLGPSGLESYPLKILHSGDQEDSTTGSYRLSSGPDSPQLSSTQESLLATPPPPTSPAKGFKTPSDWGTPAYVPDDSMPMTWGAPKGRKPQSPPKPAAMPYGGFGTAPPACFAPQPWVGVPPGPMMPPLFPTWQELMPPQQGNCGPTWSVNPNLTATQTAQAEQMFVEGIAAAAAAAAATKNGKLYPQDEKVQDLENTSEDRAQHTAEKSGAHLHPQNHPFIEPGHGKNEGLEDSVGTHIPVVRLRGLPFTASEQDILAFFSFHNVSEGIGDGDRIVRFLSKANGKPSGQAVVQMQSKYEADKAQKVLHGQWMGNRYIEVFAYGGDKVDAQPEKQNISMHQQEQMPVSQLSKMAMPPAYPWPVVWYMCPMPGPVPAK